jgi:hypothetical protein
VRDRAGAVLRSPKLWIGLTVGVLAAGIGPLYYPTCDTACYLSIARSMANGPMPANHGSPHLVFGIGYPLVVSPLFLVSDEPFLGISILHFGLACGYLYGVLVWARRYIGPSAWIIAVLAVANVVVLSLVRRPLSETLFMAVLIWLVNLLQPLASEEARPTLLRLSAAALLLALLAVTRQVGIVFGAGLAIVMAVSAWRGRVSWGRAAAVTAAVCLPAAAALASLIAYDQGTARQSQVHSHWDIFRDPALWTAQTSFVGPIVEGLRLRISEVGRLMVPGMFNSYGPPGDWLNVNLALYIPLFGVFLFGWWRLVRRRLDIAAVGLPFYLAIYIYWPFDQSCRFLAPMLPVIALAFWLALERLGERRTALFQWLVALHVLVALGYWLGRDLPQAWRLHRQWDTVRQLAGSIDANQPGYVSSRLEETRMLFHFVLDRSIDAWTPDNPPSSNTQWLVVVTNAPLPAGFSPQVTRGSLRLCRRDASPEPVPLAHGGDTRVEPR